NHSRCAVCALKSFRAKKRFLHRMESVALRQAFYGGDLFLGRGAYGKPAGTHWFAIEQNGAGAALSFAATVFGSREAESSAQDRQQGFIGGSIYTLFRSVHKQRNCHGRPRTRSARRVERRIIARRKRRIVLSGHIILLICSGAAMTRCHTAWLF